MRLEALYNIHLTMSALTTYSFYGILLKKRGPAVSASGQKQQKHPGFGYQLDPGAAPPRSSPIQGGVANHSCSRHWQLGSLSLFLEPKNHE